ncbi:mutator protein [Hordeum vulgare]|nr:mutator protein [Hordeum vulgare]
MCKFLPNSIAAADPPIGLSHQDEGGTQHGGFAAGELGWLGENGVIGLGTIFADGTGKNAPWMWLKALTVFDNKFSWGSAALAYLYRQLDDACRRSTKDGGVGGCMLILSIWSWERLPVSGWLTSTFLVRAAVYKCENAR